VADKAAVMITARAGRGRDIGDLARRAAPLAFVISAERSRQCRKSSKLPSSLVDVELYQPFVAHLQQQGLAGFLIHDVGAFHDFINLKRLLAQRTQDIFSIIQHD
jgi:hypothetical protein